MTVGQLKQALEQFTDDWPVFVDRNGNQGTEPLVRLGRRMLSAYPESESDLQKPVETEPYVIL